MGPLLRRICLVRRPPPLDLTDARLRYSAYLFINAFRTTLPDPILQEEHNVTTAAEYLSGTVIEPGAIFFFKSSDRASDKKNRGVSARGAFVCQRANRHNHGWGGYLQSSHYHVQPGRPQ